MKKYSLLGVLVVLFGISVSAAESAKIKLPDGLYMYDSSVERLTKGSERVGFGKYFVVKNNTIYNSQAAIKEFGVSELNSLFTENKNYKILFGGKKVGDIHNVKIDDEGDWNYKEDLFVKNIKEGPMYGRKSIYLGRLGSALKCVAVPEKYEGRQRKVYDTISQEEFEKIFKLMKEKLFHLIKNRKEITDLKLKYTELNEEYIDVLDKISHRDDELYIGIYRYIFKITKGSREFIPYLKFALEIAFSVKEDNVYLITSDYDGRMTISGMLDVDGDGSEELIIRKITDCQDCVSTKWLEIHKQKSDGSWWLIKKIEGGKYDGF